MPCSRANVSAQEYLGTLHRRAAMKQQYDAALAGIDALLTPTTESAAVALDAVDEAHLPSRFTRFGNLLDLCALALPNGFTKKGGVEVPTQLTFTGQLYGEADLLAVAHAYQQATGHHRRRPPMDKVTVENAG